MEIPKVSIVIPVYNVEKYLRKCLNSVVNQTLKDIEIICVNDGSKDCSLQILEEYAKKDPRIKIITKENSGYGNSMNRGFDLASGEYVGIIESDDYAELDMFEKLYKKAKTNNLDVVKSGFFYYYSNPVEKNIENPIGSKIMCSRVFCPVTDFKAVAEQVEFFNIKPSIWSAIYKRDFIRKNKIRFNETPGASFQDTSFNFKVWCCAKRVSLMEECFLHYRQDNEASSINSPGKVYCISDEYQEMEDFLKKNPFLQGKMEGIRCRLKYDSYIWNYERLSEPLQKDFIQFAAQDFSKDIALGYLEKKYFPWYKWNTLMLIIENPLKYHEQKIMEQTYQAIKKNPDNSKNYLQKSKSIFVRGILCLKEHGFRYTLGRFFEKVAWRLK